MRMSQHAARQVVNPVSVGLQFCGRGCGGATGRGRRPMWRGWRGFEWDPLDMAAHEHGPSGLEWMIRWDNTGGH